MNITPSRSSHAIEDPLEIETLRRRIDALEQRDRKHRRVRDLLVLLLLGLPLLAMAPWGSAPEDTVQARNFELVDAEGKVRGRWSFDLKKQPTFHLLDVEGKDRVGFKVTNREGPLLGLYTAEGRIRMALAIDNAGNPHMVLHDPGEKPRLHMAVSNAGAPSMIYIHEDGSAPAGMGVHADGRPWLLPAQGDAKKQSDAKKPGDDGK